MSFDIAGYFKRNVDVNIDETERMIYIKGTRRCRRDNRRIISFFSKGFYVDKIIDISNIRTYVSAGIFLLIAPIHKDNSQEDQSNYPIRDAGLRTSERSLNLTSRIVKAAMTLKDSREEYNLELHFPRAYLAGLEVCFDVDNRVVKIEGRRKDDSQPAQKEINNDSFNFNPEEIGKDPFCKDGTIFFEKKFEVDFSLDIEGASYYVSSGVLVMTFPIIENYEPIWQCEIQNDSNNVSLNDDL